jgi:hypothetical protein
VGQHHRARETRFRRRSPSSGEQDGQWLARRAAENLAVAFQAALLVRHAPSAVADAFCAGRLGERGASGWARCRKRHRRRGGRRARARDASAALITRVSRG